MAGHRVDDGLVGLAETKQDDYEKSLSLHDNVVSTVDHEVDEIHKGLEFPTEEERRTLRRVSDNMPWNAYLIVIVEMAERFSFYGSTVVFRNYIQQPLPVGSHTGAGGPNGQSGALGRGQQAAFAIGTFSQFWSCITPLLGAYIADAYLGRFKTIAYSLIIVLIGHLILIVSAVPGVIEKESAIGAFTVGTVILGLGTGGFKSNISPLVAEQYKRTKLFVSTTKKGEKVVVDPALTTAKIYMYFYFFINAGSLIGSITMAYAEKYVGFWLAYTLPTVIFFFCPALLWFSRNRYVHSPATGSVLATAVHLWRYAARGRWSWNPVELIRLMNADDFWENAKPSKVSDEAKPAWMTFDDQWVDEVRRGFKACGVFLWYPVYFLAYNQIAGNMTSQAATMTTNGLPNDVLFNLDPLALLIFIPICDLFLYPALRAAGINFSALKKICMGFFVLAAAMIWAAVIQHYVYKTNPCGYEAATCISEAGDPLVSPLNVWIQTGAYILLAISEILASITGLEYSFTKAPKNMRSLVMSLFLFMNAISSAIGEALTVLSADPLLVWNYGSMTVVSIIGGTLFWLSVRKLDADEDHLNSLSEGHIESEKV